MGTDVRYSLSSIDGQFVDGLSFCREAFQLLRYIQSSEGGLSNLNLRLTATEKRLLEEVLPITRYILARYSPGRFISVKWMSGNQRPDADLEQSGSLIERGYVPSYAHLEVTSALSRKKSHLVRQHMEKHGFAYALEGTRQDTNTKIVTSIPITRDRFQHAHDMASWVLKCVSDKLAKPYPENTILIVNCEWDGVCLSDEWQEMVTKVTRELPCHPFLEVFICDSNYTRHNTIFSAPRP